MNQLIRYHVIFLLLVQAANAQQVVETETKSDHRTQALLWVQTSLEYEVSCKQAYRLAESKLREGLANPAWSAATEQGDNFARKPPAVILDVDETVLDNSPFNARLIEREIGYDPAVWDAWCGEAKATAVPGAKRFIELARRSGVEVFFVTNRASKLKAATAKNLSEVLGHPIAEDHLLLKGERPEWSSRKTNRRAFIARSHRILLLIGDDFNDFVSIGERSPSERVKAGRHFETSLGRHWILLPNPIYGSWEKAVYDYNYRRPASTQAKMRRESLRTHP